MVANVSELVENCACFGLINAAVRRNEAASWLRRTVGVVCAKNLAEEPSEEEFRVGLRNGIILCNAVNKIQPGTVPKVAFVPFKSLKFQVPFW